MTKIPENYVDVGYNNATVKMDVDALSRESMIRLFNVRNTVGEYLDAYDQEYFNKGLPDTDDPGMASMFKEFIKLESKIIGFLSQQILYIIKPIQIALELPRLLTNPKKLVEKIKEIIKSIKDLIDDVIKLLTKTKDWFIENVLGDFLNLGVPIPEIPLNLLGIEIKIPSIDNNGMFKDETWKNQGLKNPFEENLTNEVIDIKNRLAELRDKLQKIKDKTSQNLNSTSVAFLSMLSSALLLLYVTLLQESDDYSKVMVKIHEEVLKKQDLMIKILDKNKVNYVKIDYTEEIKILIDESLSSIKENDLNVPENDLKLEEFADKLAEMIDDEEEYINDYINRYQLRKDTSFNKKITDIDETISKLYQEARIELQNIRDTKEQIKQNKLDTETLKNGLLSTAILGAAHLLEMDAIKKEIKELKDKLKNLSPASAWAETIIDFIIGIIRTPVDFIIGLISKIFEGVAEFFKQLPRPTFNKIKEFFRDLLSIQKIEDMGKVIAKIANIPEDVIETTIGVLSVVPWLVVNVAIRFVQGVILPLPIPI